MLAVGNIDIYMLSKDTLTVAANNDLGVSVIRYHMEVEC